MSKTFRYSPERPGKPAHRRFANRQPKPAPGTRADGSHVLYGVHAVVEALRNPRRRIVKLVGTENGLNRLKEEAPELPPGAEIVAIEDISRQLPKDAVHQGVLLIAEPLPALPLDALPPDALTIALDQITDPHNVGAILRSAAAFGAAAMIITSRHSPEVTGVLAKAASGALEHAPFVEVRNLARALTELRARGTLVIGLDSDAETDIGHVEARRPLCLVLGAEGKGLRPVTRAACDVVARLPTTGAIRSLNVSNAAAIALYAVTRRA